MRNAVIARPPRHFRLRHVARRRPARRGRQSLLARLTPAEWAQIVAPRRRFAGASRHWSPCRSRVSPDQIIRRYYQTGTRLKLTEAQLAALREEGVDQRVLDYIASAEQDAARTDAITAQADQAAQARLAYDRAMYATWWGGYPDYAGYWGRASTPTPVTAGAAAAAAGTAG